VKVSYHVFKDFRLEVAAGTDEEKLALLSQRKTAKAKRNLYSFVSMCFHPARRKLYLGATNRGGDILVEFDLRTRKFRSCGFQRSGLCGPNDAKIHKGIWLNEEQDALYFGIATLSPLPQTVESRGGTLVRYDIAARKFRRVANPTPGDYHQATVFDFPRGKTYMFTDRGGFAAYDLRRRKLIRYESMESAPHNGCLDDAGGVWGTFGPGRQAFYRYDPDRNRFEFPGTTFPDAVAAAGVMYPGAGPIDSIINGGDGYLYTANALGEFYRLDPRDGQLKYLGKPFTGKRLPGLGIGQDGWLYLCGGRERASMLARYSREEERFEYLGNVEHKDGTYLHYVHELVVVDGVVYIGETDNPTRSGYLWVCEV
jgi:hypothetical protein